jgi:hypothetical protein
MIDQPEVFLKVVAWGVLSGYVGIRLLNPLSTKLVQDIANSAAKKAMQETTTVNWELSLYVQEGDQLLIEYDRLLFENDNDHKKLLDSSNAELAHKKLKSACDQYDLALSIDSLCREANRGKARALRREAELMEKEEKDASNKWKSAIQQLTDIIKWDPNSAFALYNRACYRTLSSPSDSSENLLLALEDLGVAIKIHDKLKSKALTDPDFNKLRKNKERKKDFEDLLK